MGVDAGLKGRIGRGGLGDVDGGLFGRGGGVGGRIRGGVVGVGLVGL